MSRIMALQLCNTRFVALELRPLLGLQGGALAAVCEAFASALADGGEFDGLSRDDSRRVTLSGLGDVVTAMGGQ
jgi:hypothetical protein